MQSGEIHVRTHVRSATTYLPPNSAFQAEPLHVLYGSHKTTLAKQLEIETPFTLFQDTSTCVSSLVDFIFYFSHSKIKQSGLIASGMCVCLSWKEKGDSFLLYFKRKTSI